MSATLDRAVASLARMTNAATAVNAAFAAITAEIRTKTDDPRVLATLDEIDAKSADIVASALANTPVADQVKDKGPDVTEVPPTPTEVR